MNKSRFRILVAVAAAGAALWASTALAAGPTLERGYPELHADGWTWWVAQWSDNSYSLVPWSGPEGTLPDRAFGANEIADNYPELGPGGCVWYVVKWGDGVFQKAPFECPTGVTLFKDGSTQGAPTVGAGPAPPAIPVPTAVTDWEFPIARVDGVDANCGITNFVGAIIDSDGLGIHPALAVRVTSADGDWTALSNLSAGGTVEITLAQEAKPGLWTMHVDKDGQQVSPDINIRTDGPDNCATEGDGVQTVYFTFQANHPRDPVPSD